MFNIRGKIYMITVPGYSITHTTLNIGQSNGTLTLRLGVNGLILWVLFLVDLQILSQISLRS